MQNHISGINEDELLRWIETSIRTGSNILSHGYQGHIYLYQGESRRLIIKAPMGWGVGKFIRRIMLRNEFRIYSRLSGVGGIPRCFGFLKKKYLALQLIDGVSIKNAKIANREQFYKTLLDLIKNLHAAGVAHGDLKKKDNLLVVDQQTPCVIDFGVAVIKKKGFAPLNHFIYNMLVKFDFNAWAKLKYNGKLESISDKDREYYHRTLVETVSHKIKRIYRNCKRRLF
ncbi:MAG: RIO1 family regulatory kinase/ATPase [Thermodesulfobacteriota bacterium]|nr:RIO1 family regulatory kinase/ATPase [Thermodesulfobacteriota bacterium]